MLLASFVSVSVMFILVILKMTLCCCRLLKEAAGDVHFRKRYQLIFGGLLSVVGKSMRSEISKQEEFIRMLSAIADKVKAGKDKEVSLLTLMLFLP